MKSCQMAIIASALSSGRRQYNGICTLIEIEAGRYRSAKEMRIIEGK